MAGCVALPFFDDSTEFLGAALYIEPVACAEHAARLVGTSQPRCAGCAVFVRLVARRLRSVLPG